MPLVTTEPRTAFNPLRAMPQVTTEPCIVYAKYPGAWPSGLKISRTTPPATTEPGVVYAECAEARPLAQKSF